MISKKKARVYGRRENFLLVVNPFDKIGVSATP